MKIRAAAILGQIGSISARAGLEGYPDNDRPWVKEAVKKALITMGG